MNNPIDPEELRQSAYQKAVALENQLLEWLKAVRHIRASLEGKEILKATGGKKH
jgi:hypothetical protein